MILAAGLTPAWQNILQFESLELGEVNRAEQAHWCASGKVINVGKALHSLGARCKTLSVLGGLTGEAIRDEFEAKGIPARWVEVKAATRVCTTVLESASRRTTELVENAAAITTQELQAFQAAFGEESQRAELIVLSGSLPPGTPEDFYFRLLQTTTSRAIVDARGPELRAALAARPFLVKPNREELARTVGRTLSQESDVWEAMRELEGQGAEWVVVTDGPRPVLASHGTKRWRLHPPPQTVVNPIGSGDSLAATLAWAITAGADILGALRLAIAAAADNVTRLLPVELEAEVVRKLAADVRTEGV